MSQEAASEQALPEQHVPQSVPEQQAPGAPKGLLQQMEELMAALSADLSQLDADLQSTAERLEPEAAASADAYDNGRNHGHGHGGRDGHGHGDSPAGDPSSGHEAR